MDLDIEAARLKLLKANHLSQRNFLEDQLIHIFPKENRALEQKPEGYTHDVQRVQISSRPNEEGFCPPMEIEGVVLAEKKSAGFAILEACQAMKFLDPVHLGKYRSFNITMHFNTVTLEYKIALIGSLRHAVPLGTDIFRVWTTLWTSCPLA